MVRSHSPQLTKKKKTYDRSCQEDTQLRKAHTPHSDNSHSNPSGPLTIVT